MKPFPSPATRVNRGKGKPPVFWIDPDWRSLETRCCKLCHQYDEGLMKIGKRAYAHRTCFEARYGTIHKLARRGQKESET